jgi:TonB family protein
VQQIEVLRLNLRPSRRIFTGYILTAVASVFGSAQADDATAKATKPHANESAPAPVYEPGADVSRPKLVHYVEPSFSTKPDEAFVEGTVTISVIVNPQGQPTDLQVIKGLNAGQDHSAMEAVKQWRFQPGTKGGKPVSVKVSVQVAFHLL